MIDFSNRVKVTDHNIYIKKSGLFTKNSEQLEGVLEFGSFSPTITVFEDNIIVRQYNIETLHSNPNLKGQFLYYSISIQANNAVMIDGIISKNKYTCPSWQDDEYEAIRFQPFFLKEAEINNINLIGKGLFERGLHYKGTITPSGVRCICICDYCWRSFTIQHIHAGFSEVQYFYSSDSSQTLLVRYNEIKNLPVQLQTEVALEDLKLVEAELPNSSNQNFKFYNSFCCPHCNKPFIDFAKDNTIRTTEYYANKLINTKFIYLERP